MRHRVMMRIKYSSFIFVLLLLFTGPLYPQMAGKISGIVQNEAGEFLPGCNIIVEGTGLGAATDPDGFYVVLNILPGNYNVRAEMIGYRFEEVRNVKIMGNLTTKLNFVLNETPIAGEEVEVVDYRIPPVQKDLTYKVQALSFEEMQSVPVRSAFDVVLKQAGITQRVFTMPVSSMPVFGQFATAPTDNIHIRGGRTNEVLYLFDGIVVNDDLWGGFNLDKIGDLSLASLETYTGTFDPKYGEAMSGIINMNTSSYLWDKYSFQLRAYTDNLGVDSWSNDTYNGEFKIAGPIPGIKNTSFYLSLRNYSTDGYIFGYKYPNYVDSEGTDFSGTPEEVPLQYRDHGTYIGKFLWKPHEKFTLSLGGYLSNTKESLYNHYFKYNPDGTPRTWLDDYLGYVRFKHILGKTTFYNLTFARYNRTFQSRIWDNPENYAVLPQNGSAEFSFYGEDWVYFDSNFIRNQAALDFASQITKTHQVQLGTSFEVLKTYYERRNPDGFSFLEFYDLEPRKFGGYFNDKMEFESMGLIINAGLRFDYIDPNREYVQDIRNVEGPIEKVSARYYFSPRFGLSFPVAERAAFRFGYGHYYQYPDFYQIYSGLNRSYAKYPRPNPRLDTGAIARGDLEEERTVNYEAGVQVKIAGQLSLDIVGFYRKVSNLVGITLVEDISGAQMNVFDNINFATVKGIELSVRGNLTQNISGFVNYTFSQALVSSSFLFLQPQDLSRTFPADWDQPHVFRANLAFYFPKHKYGFSIYGEASSGFPYTANQFEPNGERAPTILQLDLMGYKDFNFFGFNQQIFFRIFNLPNRQNVWWVYADSGIPGADANPATSFDYTNNPSMWGPGRRVEIGFALSK